MDPRQTDAVDLKSLATQLQSSLEALRTEVAGAESLMKVLRGRIYSIQEALDKLDVPVAELRIPPIPSQSERQSNLTGPVHLLSDDALVLIFQSAMEGMVADKKPNQVSEYPGLFSETKAPNPWTFAAVCNRWRVVCLSSPLLWTNITQWDIPAQFPTLAALQAYRITSQLRISGTSPVVGRLHRIEARIGVDPPEQALSVLRSIVAAFPRHTTLELRGEVPCGILPPTEITFELLDNLLVEGRWWLRESGLTFQKTPRLSSITLCGMPAWDANFARPLHDLAICWASIRTLHISHIGWSAIHIQDLAHILRLTEQLSSLIISVKGLQHHADHWHGQPLTKVVLLSSLHHLVVKQDERDYPPASNNTVKFLTNLRVPNLSTLDTGNSMPGASAAFVTFIQRSVIATTITSLTVSLSFGSDIGLDFNAVDMREHLANMDDIRTLFLQLRSLQKLHLHGLRRRGSFHVGPVMLGLLQLLTWPQQPAGNHAAAGMGWAVAPACPTLKEVHCWTAWKTALDVPWMELREMVQSRVNNPGSSLDTAGRHKIEGHRSALEVLSLMEMSREMGDKMLQHLGEEDRRAMKWLVDASRSGIFKLKLRDTDGSN